MSPKVTSVTSVKLVVMVMTVPPAVVPLLVPRLETVGAAEREKDNTIARPERAGATKEEAIMSDLGPYSGSVTNAQLEYLRLLGVPFRLPLSWFTASLLISEALQDRRRGPPTPRQEAFLKRRGRWRDDLTRSQASELIGQIIEEEN